MSPISNRPAAYKSNPRDPLTASPPRVRGAARHRASLASAASYPAKAGRPNHLIRAFRTVRDIVCSPGWLGLLGLLCLCAVAIVPVPAAQYMLALFGMALWVLVAIMPDEPQPDLRHVPGAKWLNKEKRWIAPPSTPQERYLAADPLDTTATVAFLLEMDSKPQNPPGKGIPLGTVSQPGSEAARALSCDACQTAWTLGNGRGPIRYCSGACRDGRPTA